MSHFINTFSCRKMYVKAHVYQYRMPIKKYNQINYLANNPHCAKKCLLVSVKMPV